MLQEEFSSEIFFQTLFGLKFLSLFPKNFSPFLRVLYSLSSRQLCENLHLPYHYTRAIGILLKQTRKLNLEVYKNLLYFECSDLCIRMNNNPGSLEPLTCMGGCLNLREIQMDRFAGNFPGSLEPLKGCQKLEVIEMFSFDGDLGPMSACVNLREICMDFFNRSLAGLTRMGGGRNLRTIEMNGFNGDLEFLRGCVDLREIKLPYFTGSLEPLRGCTNLRIIRMAKFNMDLEPLSACLNLEVVQIGEFTGDLNPLSNCFNLREIQISSFRSLYPLRNCKKIIKLWTDFGDQMDSLKKIFAELS